MKFFNQIKSNTFLLLLLVIIVVFVVIYVIRNRSEGISTDSNLITTTNPYLIPPESALGKTNTLVMKWKEEIKTQINAVNDMFNNKGVLKPDSVTALQTAVKQGLISANPSVSTTQIDSVVTPELIKKNIRKDYIKIFLDNVIDLATLIKQNLN